MSLSVISWVFSILLSIALFPGLLDCYVFTPIVWQCSVAGMCSSNCSIFLGTLYTIVILPATILPIVFYVIIYWKARKAKKALSTTIGTGDGLQKQEWNILSAFCDRSCNSVA